MPLHLAEECHYEFLTSEQPEQREREDEPLDALPSTVPWPFVMSTPF